MDPLSYLRPASVSDATRLLSAHPEARFLSGGMSLLPMMKQGLSAPTHLVDVTRLPETHGIAIEGDRLVVGAASTHRELAQSALVRQTVPALAQLAGQIADPQVRNRGTLGGSLAHADPAADHPAAALGLAAEIETPRRRIAADDFFLGLFSTALEPDELLLRVRFRRPGQAHYEKFRHPGSGYAMVGIFIARFATHVRVAVTGAAASAFRWSEAEAALQQRFSPESIRGLTPEHGKMIEDLHAGAAYRANLARVMLERAVRTMTEAAHG